MASEWIKWTKGLTRKREVLSMSARLGTNPAHVAGLCMVLWEWMDDNVSSSQIDGEGNANVTLGALQPAFIDTLVGVSGFAAAMSAEGWLCQRSGSLAVPNYSRHNGQTSKERALTAERVARSRASKCNGRSVTSVTVSPLPDKIRIEEETHTHIAGDEKTDGLPEPEQPRAADNPQITPPTLEQVLAVANNRSVPPDCAESFFNAMMATGWVDGQQRPIRNWTFALNKYAAAWRANDHQRGQSSRGKQQPAREPQRPRAKQPQQSKLFPDGPPPGVKVGTW